MEKYLLRKDIMNLNLNQWTIIEDIEQKGTVEVTIKGFYDLLGFTGGMFLTGKANEHEAKFIAEFYDYGREKAKADAAEGKLPLCGVSFAYELLKQWLEYVEDKQMSAPIEDTEKWISEYES